MKRKINVLFTPALALVLFILGVPAGTVRADLMWSTFLGGNQNELGYDIATDNSCYAFVIGNTESSDFPTIYGSYDSTYNSGYTDVFVTKFNMAGSDLVYSTFLGGGQRR